MQCERAVHCQISSTINNSSSSFPSFYSLCLYFNLRHYTALHCTTIWHCCPTVGQLHASPGKPTVSLLKSFIYNLILLLRMTFSTPLTLSSSTSFTLPPYTPLTLYIPLSLPLSFPTLLLSPHCTHLSHSHLSIDTGRVLSNTAVRSRLWKFDKNCFDEGI